MLLGLGHQYALRYFREQCVEHARETHVVDVATVLHITLIDELCPQWYINCFRKRVQQINIDK